MKRIAVEEIQDDMVLNRDVCGASGNVLLGKGTKINAGIGRRLKNWGILSVYIEGAEEGVPSDVSTQPSSVEVKEKLEKMFSRVIDNVIMKKIFAAVYQHKIQKGG